MSLAEQLTEEDFNACIEFIKTNYPDIKLRIYRKNAFTPGGASGEYMEKKLSLAIGPEKTTGVTDWGWVVGTVAHEFAHYLREHRHSDKYNQRLYEASALLYDPKSTDKARESAAYWVIFDEYGTDIEAFEIVLRDWNLQHHFTDWFYWANCYNYKIKYLLETGILFSDREGIIKAPNRKLTKEELHKPLSRKKKREIDLAIENETIRIALVDYHKNVINK